MFGGRAFLHRIRHLRFSKSGEHALSPHLHVHLDVEFKADVQWWFSNISRLNGQRPLVVQDDSCLIQLDATGNGGLGIFIDGGFVSLAPEEVLEVTKGLSIPPPTSNYANEWECYNVAVLLHLFGEYLESRSVVIWCDNQCTVSAIHKLAVTKANASVLAGIVRCVFDLCLRYNVCLRPKWIAGVENVLADALSRQRWPTVATEMQFYIVQQGYEPSSWFAVMEQQ